MSELEVITTIEQPAVRVKLTGGEYTVKPLTVRRLAHLGELLRNLRGDASKLSDPDSPAFQEGVTDILRAAGDKMPEALSALTGDAELAKLPDISLLDLGVLVLAAAKVNKANKLKEFFQQAKAEIAPEKQQ